MRALTSSQVVCVMVQVVLLTGCGSPPDANGPGSDVHPSTYAPPAAPSGPYDSDHRDEALALAMSAGRKSTGHPTLSEPVALFGPMFFTAQAPGQPPSTPVFGWDITFKAVLHHDPTESLDPGQVGTYQPHRVGTDVPLAPTPTPAPVINPKEPFDPQHPVYTPSPQVATNLPQGATVPTTATIQPLAINPTMPQPSPSHPVDGTITVAAVPADVGQRSGAQRFSEQFFTVRVFVSVDGHTQIMP